MLIQAPDTEYLKNRYINEEKNIEIGIYPVLFGWRVHAGIIDSGWYHLDYCGGDKPEFIALLQTIVKTIVEKYDYDFSVFPRQNRKPVFTDIDCFAKLVELAGGDVQNLDIVKIPDLNVLRSEIMSNILK